MNQDAPGPETASEKQLRQNVEALMALRGMNQTTLAEKLGKSQSWVSKRLSGKPQPQGSRFQFEDLDALAHVFGFSPATLLQPGHGKWDQRQRERRSGTDRRASARKPYARNPGHGTIDNEAPRLSIVEKDDTAP